MGDIVEYRVHKYLYLVKLRNVNTVIMKYKCVASYSSAVNKVTASCKLLYGIS